jgi:hypothetical protein
MSVQIVWGGPIIAPRAQLTCPFCLAPTPAGGSPPKCESCSQDLPPLYVAAMASSPPPQVLPLQVFGLSRHGKTAYLAALTTLLRSCVRIWDGCICQPATPPSQNQLQLFDRCFRNGEMPPPTPPDFDECHVLLVPQLGCWGAQAVLVRDGPGDAFASMTVAGDRARFLLKAPLTFMFLSLADAAAAGLPIEVVMNNFLHTLVGGGVSLDQTPRKLVLVLTKADLITDLPADLWEYVLSDPLRPVLLGEPGAAARRFDPPAIEDYMRTLRRVGLAAEEWFAQSAERQAFLALARAHRIEVSVALVWATGFDPGEDNRQRFAWRPCRVLDPLFLGLDMSRRGL